jgi:hypothetical protein
MITTIPPRLWIVHRPETHHALIIRRGPGKVTGFFGWNRRTNEVTVGQWMKSKVYPFRADISPKGTYLIYFSLNGYWNSETKGAYTAVSRYPYLKALDLWPKGDAWHGGGLFVSEKEYVLNGFYIDKPLHQSGKFKISGTMPPSPVLSGEDPGIYFPKLLRDGWEYTETREEGPGKIHRFVKAINRQLTLEKSFHVSLNSPPGKGVYYETHKIKGIDDAAFGATDLENLDVYRSQLFWTNAGQLFTARFKQNQVSAPVLVHDFNQYEFTAIAAPY